MPFILYESITIVQSAHHFIFALCFFQNLISNSSASLNECVLFIQIFLIFLFNLVTLYWLKSKFYYTTGIIIYKNFYGTYFSKKRKAFCDNGPVAFSEGPVAIGTGFSQGPNGHGLPLLETSARVKPRKERKILLPRHTRAPSTRDRERM